MRRCRVAACAGLVALLAAAPAWAEPSDPRRAALADAYAAAMDAAARGPTELALRDQAVLGVAARTAFVPQPQAGGLIRALGNRAEDHLLGVVLPLDRAGWLIEVAYTASGHVPEDDAGTLDPGSLLIALRDTTQALNAARTLRGLPALALKGWLVPPAYDRMAHRLTWATLLRVIGAAEDAQPDATLRTDVLGRDGYFSLDLTSSPAELLADRPIAEALLAGLRWRRGRGYADFVAATDTAATYGLAGLMGVSGSRTTQADDGADRLTRLAGLLTRPAALLAEAVVVAIGAAVALRGIRARAACRQNTIGLTGIAPRVHADEIARKSRR